MVKVAVVFYHKNIFALYDSKWIDKCVLSILGQTYQDFDIFEVNYGNEDVSVLDGYHIEGKIRYFYKQSFDDHTYAMNFILNEAFSAGYDIVFNTNLDDMYHLTRFQYQIDYVNKGYELISSYWIYIDGNENHQLTLDNVNLKLDSKRSQKSIGNQLKVNHNIINHSCVCFTRKFWYSYDSDDNLLRYTNTKPYEDLILWKRAFKAGIKFGIVDRVLIYYRIHNNQICSDNRGGKKFPDYPSLLPSKRVGILLVATGRYKNFVDKIMKEIKTNFLVNYPKTFFLFVDSTDGITLSDDVITTIIKRRGFPGDTLYRYHYFLKQYHAIIQLTDVVYYFDVDMGIPLQVGNDVLPTPHTPFVGVRHPGFYMSQPFSDPYGTPETCDKSTACISLNERINNYIAGGFNGGISEKFLKMCEIIKRNIDIDDKNEVIAIWHDESHLNRYFTSHIAEFKVLKPEYCYPEGLKIPFTPRIVALNKDHNFYRHNELYLTCEMMGRLGNTLFQVATVLATAKKYNMVPVFQLLRTDNLTSYRNSVLQDLHRINTSKVSFDVVNETHFYHDPIEKPTTNTKLVGYYQSWKYFDEYKNDLKNIFRFESNLATSLYKTITSLFNDKTVGVHIRRGDYLKLSEYHYNLTENYYQEACSSFDSDSTFIIVSDDIGWCKECPVFSALGKVHFVENTSEIDDFSLLLQCKNIVISNSSFSWWAAYLSEKDMVVCPPKWFGPKGPQYKTDDLFPPTWRVIGSNLNPGLTFVIRAKNEGLNVQICLSSLLPLLDDPLIKIVYIDNNSTDNTFVLASEYAKNYPNQISIHQYMIDVARCGDDHVKAVDNGQTNTLDVFYNWCLSKCTTYNMIKWDADFMANIKNLKEMINTYQLTSRNDYFSLWCTGETVIIKDGLWYKKQQSYYDEFRCFSVLHGFKYVLSPDKRMETFNGDYFSYHPPAPHIVYGYAPFTGKSNNVAFAIKFFAKAGKPEIANQIDINGKERKCYKLENGSLTHNWKVSPKYNITHLPPYREVYEEPVFIELKRIGTDEFVNKSLCDVRDTQDYDIMKSLSFDNKSGVVDCKKNKFVIVVPSYECPTLLQKCLSSIQRQRYKNFKVVVIDDASPSVEHKQIAYEWCDKNNWTLIRNNVNCGALKNIIMAISTANCTDDDIIVTLDGDDWLHPNALEILNYAYQDNTSITYGRFLFDNPPGLGTGYECYPDHSFGFSEQVPQHVIDKKSFREYGWIFSHLRTFKHKLWKNIKHKDLQYPDGTYYDVTWDLAFMYPMLEMAGNNIKFINFPLYHYNISNPLNDFKIKQAKQATLEKVIRAKLKYPTIL